MQVRRRDLGAFDRHRCANPPLLWDHQAVLELGVGAYLGIPLTTAQGYTLGSLCVIDVKPRPWTAQDIEIIRDLAALVVKEIELRLLAKRLYDDYMTLRNLELHRDEMVHMLVHDLRNPLSSFLSGLELMERNGELKDKQKKYVTIAQRGGEMLLRMIGSILDASKAKAGHLELNLAEITPAQVIEGACCVLGSAGANEQKPAVLNPQMALKA